MSTKITGNTYNTIWTAKAIGEPFFLWDHLIGCPVPDQDSGIYRFVKLVADDAYNTGVLVNQVMTGTDPEVQATADIDFPLSPIHGLTLRLIGTEKRVIRAGVNSGAVEQDALQNIIGTMSSVRTPGGASGTGAFVGTVVAGTYGINTGSNNNAVFDFDASRVARTDNETRAKGIYATPYVRIW